MEWYKWLQEEINKATKKRNIKEIIYPNLFTKSFMSDNTTFSHIKDLFDAARALGYLSDEIKKEDLDKYLSIEDCVIFIRWDDFLNEAINQYKISNIQEGCQFK